MLYLYFSQDLSKIENLLNIHLGKFGRKIFSLQPKKGSNLKVALKMSEFCIKYKSYAVVKFGLNTITTYQY